jgi:myo-inositol-1(or 4)-monophosphatase
VSIALQGRSTQKVQSVYEDGYQTLVGVVYDPFCDEMWTARAGRPALLNGRPIRVSQHTKLSESIISIGFAKTRKTLEHTLPYFNQLVRRVRKVRIMGSAALALTYVATGRFDAYIERGIRLWDIAAGGLIIECAGGEFWRKSIGTDHKYRMIASNGRLRKTLRVPD